jgi:hypothetical protein
MLKAVILPVGTFAVGGLLGILIGVVAVSIGQQEAATPRTVEETVTETRYVTVTAPPEEHATATASASATASATDPGEATMSCEIGEECDLGPGTVLVTGAREAKTLTAEYATAEAGNFVVVEYTYTWNGDAPTDLGEIPWTLTDGEGNSYTYDFDVTNNIAVSEDKSTIYEEAQPGVALPGMVIFSVAPDSGDFTLTVTDLGNPQAGEAANINL